MVALAFFIYIVLGGYLVIIGANQHVLEAAFGLDLTQTGLLGALVSLGIGLGVLGSGPVLDHRPRRPLTLVGALLAAAALGSVAEGMSFTRLALHVFVGGVGIGALDNLCNVLMVERFRQSAGRTLSFLHSAATLGAFVTPLVIAALTPESFRESFRALALGCVAIAGAALWVEMPPPPSAAAVGAGGAGAGPETEAKAKEETEAGTRTAIRPATEARGSLGLTHPVFLAMCVVGFAYVGVETGVTVFAVPYATDTLEVASQRGQMGISAFWCGLFVGRLAVSVGFSRPSAGLLTLSGVASTVLLGVAVGLRWSALEWWMAAVGLVLAGVYPVMVAVAGGVIERGTGRALGLMTAIASSGGFVVPWLTGAIGDAIGAGATMQFMGVWSAAIAVAAGVAFVWLRRGGVAKGQA